MNRHRQEQLRKLRVAVAIQCSGQSIQRRHVADRMGVPVSELNNWLNGILPAPTGLVGRLEAALGLPAGCLPQLTDDERQSEDTSGGA